MFTHICPTCRLSLQAKQEATFQEVAEQQTLLEEANTSFEAVQTRTSGYSNEKVELTRRLNQYKKEVERLTRQMAATNEDNVLLGKQVQGRGWGAAAGLE